MKYVPSFCLGIHDEYDSHIISEEDNDFVTPKPAIREKSTRIIKAGRYAKSPYIDRIIDISAKYTTEDIGLWRFIG